MSNIDIPKNSKIAVGLSGGVDSAVSAFLLKQQSFEVVGVHMQCWDYDAKGCTGTKDRADAVEVATLLGIKFISLDFQEEYKQKVLDHFFAEYKAGRTPNPDVLCNKEIKFGLFLNWALTNGYSHIATGHYATLTKDTFYELARPKDATKDQTYFLYQLGQKELSHAVFPLGDCTKKEVRKIALAENIPVAQKDESFGVCFIGNIDLKDFLATNAGFVPKLGNVLDTDGNIIGTHMGAYAFTAGQRHGFTINKYQGEPRYVLKKDVATNEIVVGSHAECMSDKFALSNIHWIGKTFEKPMSCKCRIRHLGQLYVCEVNPTTLHVSLDQPAFAVASGQSAVFYKDDVVLGGGVIA